MRRLSLLLAACSLLIACGSSIDDVVPLSQGGSAGSAAGNTSAGTGGGGSAGAGGIGVGGATMSGGSTNGGSANAGGMLGTGGTLGASGGADRGGATSGGNNGKGGMASGSGGASSAGAANGGARQSGGATQGGAAQAGAAQGGTAQGGATGAAGGTHTNPLTQAQIDAFVNAHNEARSGNLNPPPSPPLPPVTWDATLADVAFNYLSKCQGTTLSDHNANRTKDYAALGGKDYVGENIYASSGKSVDPAAAVKSWMSEADDFDYDSPNLSAAGHYTQVVWRTSVRIGCAIVNCPNMKYPNNVLCDYAPGGNVNGQKPY
jgi:uncharacterized protein YkwD